MPSIEGLSLETVKGKSLQRAKRGWGLAGTSRERGAVSGLQGLVSRDLGWPSAMVWPCHAPPPPAPLPEWCKSRRHHSSHTTAPSTQEMLRLQGHPEPWWDTPSPPSETSESPLKCKAASGDEGFQGSCGEGLL